MRRAILSAVAALGLLWNGQAQATSATFLSLIEGTAGLSSFFDIGAGGTNLAPGTSDPAMTCSGTCTGGTTMNAQITGATFSSTGQYSAGITPWVQISTVMQSGSLEFAFSGSGNGVDQCMVCTQAADGYRGWIVFIDGAGVLTVMLAGLSAPVQYTCGTSYSDGNTHYFQTRFKAPGGVVTWDVFIDGALVSCAGTPTNVNPWTPPVSIALGNQDTRSDRHLSGVLGVAAFYTTFLSDADVTAHSSCAVSGTCSTSNGGGGEAQILQ